MDELDLIRDTSQRQTSGNDNPEPRSVASQTNRQTSTIRTARGITTTGGKCYHVHKNISPPDTTHLDLGIQPGPNTIAAENLQELPVYSLRAPRSSVNAVLRPPNPNGPEVTFSSNVQLFLWSNDTRNPCRNFPVKDLLWREAVDFFQWYATESGATIQISVLRFELWDVQRQDRRAFLVPGSEWHYFQQLKKLFWDMFWIESSLNGSLMSFQLHISVPENGLGGWRKAAVANPPVISAGSSMTANFGTDAGFTVTGFNSPPKIRSNVHKLLNPT